LSDVSLFRAERIVLTKDESLIEEQIAYYRAGLGNRTKV